jgi:vitamin B12 transporter
MQTRRRVRLLLTVFLALSLPLHSQEEERPGEDWPEDFPVFEAEELSVTGVQETTQEIRTIRKEDIEKANASGLSDLLQKTLDVSITTYGGYGTQTDINLRGFDSERIAFLVDGVPANSLMSGEFDFNQIDLNSVERIEVIYGGSDTKFNVTGAFGGVVNIVTVKKQPPGIRVNASVSNTASMPGTYRTSEGAEGKPRWEDLGDTQKVTAGAAYGGENTSWTANLFTNRAGNHFLYQQYTGAIRRHEYNEVSDMGLSGSFVRTLPDGLASLAAKGGLYYGNKNIPVSFGARAFGVQRDFSFNQSLLLDAPRAFHDDFQTEATLTHNWNRVGYEPPSGDASLHDQHSLNTVNRWAWYAGDALTVRAGFDCRSIWLTSTQMDFKDRSDGGPFAGAEWWLGKQFLVMSSVKLAMNNRSATPVEAVPKLGFLWRAAETLDIKNNYFRSFKYPDFEDLYWQDGQSQANPDLRNEDGWGGDLGLAWRPRIAVGWPVSGFTLEGTGFAQWTTDSIHWYASQGGWKPQNVGEAVFFGADSRLHFDVSFWDGPVKGLGVGLSYQYLTSYLLCYGYTWKDNKRIPYQPAHMAGFSLELPWTIPSGTGSVALSGHYESLRYADTSNLRYLRSYFLLNLDVSQRLGKNTGVFMNLRNLLNQRYETFADYPMPGFTVTVGMKVSN